MADSVNLGSVYATLDLRTDGFTQGARQAQGAMGDLRTTVAGVFGGNVLFSAVQRASDAVLGFAKTAVTSSADLQTSLNLLKVVTGATGDQMEDLRKKSIELGNDITLPGVSAADAADAMVELGKSGLAVNDILSASKGVLQAAKAGNIGVADSAKLVATSLLAFNLSGEEAIRVADLMASASNASSLEMDGVGLALQQAGAQARAAGVPIEQTVGIIAQLANNGIRAEQAGTSLSYMIRQLTAPTEKARKVMKNLGLSVFDADGNFVGMRETINRLNGVTKNMSQEQRAAAFNVLFGAEAMKAASVLVDEGTAGFDKMQQAVNKTGSAADLAGARTKGFNGVIQALQSQFETLAIQVGEKVLPILEAIGGFISGNFTPVFIALAGAIGGVLLAALLAVLPAIGAILAPFAAVIGIAAGVGALAAAFYVLYQRVEPVRNAVAVVIDAFKSLFEIGRLLFTGDFRGGIFGLTEDSGTIDFLFKIRDVLVEVWKVLRDSFIKAWEALKDIFVTSVIPAFKEIWQVVQDNKKVFILLGAVLAAAVFGPLALAVAAVIALLKAFDFLSPVIKVVINVIGELIEFGIKFVNFLINAVIFAIKAVIAYIQFWIGFWQTVINVIILVGQTIFNVFTTIYNTIVTILTAVWSFVSPILEFIKNLFIIVFGSILIVILTVFKAIYDTITAVISAVWGFLQPIIQAIVGFFKERWENLKNNTLAVFNALKDFFTNIWNTIYGVIRSIVQRIIDFFAPALSWLYEKGRAIIQGLINGIRNLASGVWNAVKSVADQIGQFFSGAGRWLFDAGKAIFQGLIDGMKAIGNKVKETAENIVSKVRDLLPFSPAKDGPFSGRGWTLYSGRSLMEGFAQGIKDMAALPANAMTDALNQATIGNALNATGSLAPSQFRNQPTGSGGGSVAIYGDVNIRNKQEEDDFLGMNELVQEQLNAARGMAV